MKFGTHIKLPDGRLATVVFSGLCGYGIKFGIFDLSNETVIGCGDLEKIGVNNEYAPAYYKYFPDAYLRNKEDEQFMDLECVGTEWEVID